MATFYFDLHECGFVVEDEVGRELSGLGAARDQALEAARDLMSAEVRKGRLCLSCHIEIRDASGEVLHTFRFEDALVISGLATLPAKSGPCPV